MARPLTERLRGRAGVAQRQRRLKRSGGLCEICLVEGKTRVADVVDHEVPLALGGFDVDGNTRNLCHEHHAKVTAEQFGHQLIEAKGVGADGRPTSPDHTWNVGLMRGVGSKLQPAPCRTPRSASVRSGM